MSTKKDPAFLFYATAWLQSRDVNSMTLEQQGAYVRLLCFAWLHGSIPADHDELCNILGLGGDRVAFDRIWSRLSRRWSKMPGNPGELINQRQEQERAERKAKAEEMRQRGAAGGRQSADQRASRDPSRGQAGGQADVPAETKPSTSTSTTSDSQTDRGALSVPGDGVPETPIRSDLSHLTSRTGRAVRA